MVEDIYYLVVICLKIRTFVVSATTQSQSILCILMLWFAWKFVPLWYQQQHVSSAVLIAPGCDLLENSYLCGISNNQVTAMKTHTAVVICLKIRTFVVSATTGYTHLHAYQSLWFAWKFVPLWYQQQHQVADHYHPFGCDLLENSYLCGISNNTHVFAHALRCVVICLKIRTFVVSATTRRRRITGRLMLWFAWKFVPLWYQQQLRGINSKSIICCDLLENSYLCGISNNLCTSIFRVEVVVICLKIRTFVVSATTYRLPHRQAGSLWFAWKFVPLWYQQQPYNCLLR